MKLENPWKWKRGWTPWCELTATAFIQEGVGGRRDAPRASATIAAAFFLFLLSSSSPRTRTHVRTLASPRVSAHRFIRINWNILGILIGRGPASLAEPRRKETPCVSISDSLAFRSSMISCARVSRPRDSFFLLSYRVNETFSFGHCSLNVNTKPRWQVATRFDRLTIRAIVRPRPDR